jgi:hypothetical protein
MSAIKPSVQNAALIRIAGNSYFISRAGRAMSEEEINWDALEIELLPKERKLLLKYGYPYDDARQQLEKMVASKQVIETMVISRYYLNQMIGDLCYSINKRTKGNVQADLLDLCERLESAERWGDGDLDIMW